MTETPTRLLGNAPLHGGWRLLRFENSLTAELRPGHHVALAGTPLPIMSAGPRELSLLAPPLEHYSQLRPHSTLALAGPIGTAWPEAAPARAPVVLAQGLGVGCALFLIERLAVKPRLALLEAEPPPFRPTPSQFVIPALPPHVIAAAPMLEQRDVPSRVASPSGAPGCFEGGVVELWQTLKAEYAAAPVFVSASAETLASLADAEIHPSPLPG